jgi:hypothetical protein
LLIEVCNPCLQENVVNMNTVFIRAAIATAFVGLGFASVHAPRAAAAHAAVTMSVDARAPLHATLLPAISVFADARNPDAPVASRVTGGEALPVTLMPTVYVSTQRPGLAEALRPQDAIQFVADDEAAPELPRIDAARTDAPLVLRAHAMPR